MSNQSQRTVSAYLGDDEWGHGRQRSLVWLDEIRWSRWQEVRGNLRGCREVTHLIVEHDTCSRRENPTSKWIINSCSHRYSIPICIYNTEMAGTMISKLTPPASRGLKQVKLQSVHHKAEVCLEFDKDE